MKCTKDCLICARCMLQIVFAGRPAWRQDPAAGRIQKEHSRREGAAGNAEPHQLQSNQATATSSCQCLAREMPNPAMFGSACRTELHVDLVMFAPQQRHAHVCSWRGNEDARRRCTLHRSMCPEPHSQLRSVVGCALP